MKGKCLLISSTIVIFFSLFSLNVMNNHFEKESVKIVNTYQTTIDSLLTDKEFFESYKLAWEKDKIQKNTVPDNPNKK